MAYKLVNSLVFKWAAKLLGYLRPSSWISSSIDPIDSRPCHDFLRHLTAWSCEQISSDTGVTLHWLNWLRKPSLDGCWSDTGYQIITRWLIFEFDSGSTESFRHVPLFNFPSSRSSGTVFCGRGCLNRPCCSTPKPVCFKSDNKYSRRFRILF